jgi:hypothetical protein
MKPRHIHILKPAYSGKYSNKAWLALTNRFRVASKTTDIDGTEYVVFDTTLYVLLYEGKPCTVKTEATDKQSHMPTTMLTRLADIRKLVKRMNGVFETTKFGYKQIYKVIEENNK